MQHLRLSLSSNLNSGSSDIKVHPLKTNCSCCLLFKCLWENMTAVWTGSDSHVCDDVVFFIRNPCPLLLLYKQGNTKVSSTWCFIPYNQAALTAVDLLRFALNSKQCSSRCSFMVTTSTCSIGSIYSRSSPGDALAIWADFYLFFKLGTVWYHHSFRGFYVHL